MDQSSTRSSAKPKEQPRVNPGPGGAMSHRQLPFYWLVDVSGSMDGEKINALNKAIRDTVPAMQTEAKNNHEVDLKVNTIAFHDIAEFLATAVPVDQFEWNDLDAGGETAMGAALGLVIDDVNKMLSNKQKIIPPVLVLISDGMPTDEGMFLSHIDTLDKTPWGKKAIRIAISFKGAYECDEELLKKFAGKSEHVFQVYNNPEYLTNLIRWVSTSVATSTSVAPAAKIEGGRPQQTEFSSPPPSTSGGGFDVWDD